MNALLAAGRVDVTPEGPLPLAGYADRAGPSAGVHDPLELNAILLEAGGRRLAVLSADALFLTAELKTHILDEAGRELGLDDASLLCTASHTHSAPALDPSKPRLGAVAPAYAEFVARRAVALLRDVGRGPRVPCRVTYRAGAAEHAINRRRLGWQLSPLPRRGVVRAPNPAGPRDEALHVFRCDAADGRPLALLWSYACHPVGFPDHRSVSADFPGVARARLRAALGAELPVVFLQGCAGDIRPRELAPGRTFARRLAERVMGKLFTPFTPAEYAAWAESLAQRVADLAREATAGHALDIAPRAAHARFALDEILDGAPAGCSVTAQRIELSADARITALSAEPVAEYGLALRAREGGIVVPVGYSDSVFGYLPSARMLGQHGYEDEGFMPAFGITGRFRPDVERLTLAACERLRRADD
ncbi:MAG TPA: hypothetical protein VI139_00830 [Gemmatimonadales bacterium]